MMNYFNDMFTGKQEQAKKERTPDEVQAFVNESKENRQKCYTMADEMALKVGNDPASLQLYLDVQGTFPRYSVNNALLLAEQRPEATQIGDLRYWREQKVYIQNSEFNNPILILEPGDEYRREDGSIGTYYNAKKVYDVSQTKQYHHKEHGRQFDINMLCMALAKKSPVSFSSVTPEQMPEGYAVLYDDNSNKIYMRNGLDDGNKVFQLTSMEIAHALMAQNNPQYDRNECHMYAYAASYLLCKQYGVPTDGYEFDVSVQGDGKEPQDIKKELMNIKAVADEISNRMEPALVKNRAVKEAGFER
ncbi:hypothetical protein [[Eubacterium] hominis]|uniref:hypothetical protein n=1 Tax=[Eubacterium] hominis TaxID=2764325 RepID=UPI003A4DD664